MHDSCLATGGGGHVKEDRRKHQNRQLDSDDPMGWKRTGLHLYQPATADSGATKNC